ncbi:hypothetical protein FHS43_000952 [Streptosporangium becharense]|uniref:Secreted protein n=1 Tax=Streptosporangium becharense TaxID=1816182 RepID=A0A7W9IFS7_9ACTN|nr:DUF5719 family protein [Streptosporangium becharense]MBB2909706.1 hypothetical protein [Streptosporangium becharense]MBB5819338.1 hypothetical protein [Streptosporangium becharense]
MKSLAENRYSLPALVLVALFTLYGVASAGRPDATVRPPGPERVPVAEVTTVCPAPGAAGVGVITPVGGQGTGTTTLVTGDRTLATLDAPGTLWHEEVPAGSPPLVTTATGGMAAGLEVAQTRRETSGGQRGLAGVRCTEPVASTWLVGPGPAAADVTLHLTNADLAPAVVEVMVHAGEGPVFGDTGGVLTLRAGESRTVKVAELAPSPLVMALHVRTVSGRVAAAARAVMSDGRGVDWLPAAAPPATRVVVPGVPGGGGERRLLVASVEETDTLVEVKVLTSDGGYALKGREVVEVPARSVATLDLSAGVGGRPAALVLTSDAPIVAGLVATGTGARGDVAFTAGAVPIDLGSVVADNRTGGKRNSRLLLTAPDTIGRVSVQVLPRKGEPRQPFQVDIPAGRTKQVKLPEVDGPFAVVLLPLPGSGPVYGGRVMEERLKGGQALTVQPLATARTWALVPPITESAAVVLP